MIETIQKATDFRKSLVNLYESLDLLRVDGKSESQAETTEADPQAKLKEIKKQVQDTYNDLQKMSKSEISFIDNFMGSAMRQIWTSFSMRTSTKPYSPKWGIGISNVTNEISYHISRLDAAIETLSEKGRSIKKRP